MAYVGNAPAAGLIGGGNVQDGSITNADLAAGVAVANLGYTPVNKAGDTMSGPLRLGSSSEGGTFVGISDGATDGSNYGTFQITKPMDHDNRWHYSAIQAGQQVAGIGYKDNASSHFVVGVGGNPSQAYGSSSLYHSQYMEQWVNGSPRLKVDDSGRISMPYQPAFLAAVTGGVYTSGVFGGSLVTNHGLPAQRSSGYSNGTYTAPVSGLYQFNFNIYDFNSTAFTLAVYINGSGYIPGDWYQFATHANSQNTWSFQVYLNANDYIQMGIRGSSNINIYNGHTYWGGYLIG